MATLATLESQWRDIRSAYKRILHHAFDNEASRDAANVVMLKMGASVIDLALCGDPSLKKAMVALIGSDSHDDNTDRPDRNIYEDTNATSAPDVPNVPNVPNISNIPNIPNIANLSNMFTFADSFFNRPGGVNTFISDEELRNLFPLWNMFNNSDATRSPEQENTNRQNEPSDR